MFCNAFLSAMPPTGYQTCVPHTHTHTHTHTLHILLSCYVPLLVDMLRKKKYCFKVWSECFVFYLSFISNSRYTPMICCVCEALKEIKLWKWIRGMLPPIRELYCRVQSGYSCSCAVVSCSMRCHVLVCSMICLGWLLNVVL